MTARNNPCILGLTVTCVSYAVKACSNLYELFKPPWWTNKRKNQRRKTKQNIYCKFCFPTYNWIVLLSQLRTFATARSPAATFFMSSSNSFSPIGASTLSNFMSLSTKFDDASVPVSSLNFSSEAANEAELNWTELKSAQLELSLALLLLPLHGSELVIGASFASFGEDQATINVHVNKRISRETHV